MRSVFVRFYCIPFSVLLFSPQKTRFRNTSNQLNYCQFECEGTEFAVVAAAAAISLHTHKRTHSYLFTSCCYLNKIYSSRSSFSFRLFFFHFFPVSSFLYFFVFRLLLFWSWEFCRCSHCSESMDVCWFVHFGISFGAPAVWLCENISVNKDNMTVCFKSSMAL